MFGYPVLFLCCNPNNFMMFPALLFRYLQRGLVINCVLEIFIFGMASCEALLREFNIKTASSSVSAISTMSSEIRRWYNLNHSQSFRQFSTIQTRQLNFSDRCYFPVSWSSSLWSENNSYNLRDIWLLQCIHNQFCSPLVIRILLFSLLVVLIINNSPYLSRLMRI